MLVRLFLLEQVKPSSNRKMIKLLTVDITFFRHYGIPAKTCSRMTAVITFSRQNDAGLRARTWRKSLPLSRPRRRI